MSFYAGNRGMNPTVAVVPSLRGREQDLGNVSVTLQTLERAALALGKRLKIELA